MPSESLQSTTEPDNSLTTDVSNGSQMSRRNFLQLAGLATAGAVLHGGLPEAPTGTEEMTDEEYVEFHSQGLLDVYNVDVGFDDDAEISAQEQRCYIEIVLSAISRYPPHAI